MTDDEMLAAKNYLEKLHIEREQTFNELVDIARQGNEWLNLNWTVNCVPFYNETGKVIYIRKKDVFVVPMPALEYQYNSRYSFLGKQTQTIEPRYEYPYPDKSELMCRHCDEWVRQDEKKFGWTAKGYKPINEIEAFDHKIYEYYKKKYHETYAQLTSLAKKILKIQQKNWTILYEAGNYHVKFDQNALGLRNVAKSLAWNIIKSNFSLYVFLSLKIFWWVALIIAIILYLFSHLPVRYKLAPTYERIMRFFEQGRFGMGGSSRFAGIIEEWASLYKRQKNAIFLGRSLFNPNLLIGSEDKRHMLTVAPTRAGKGATSIIPNLLLWEGSALVIDPKGTNAAVTARQRRKMGQNVYVIDPFNMVEEETAKFNPLAHLDPDSPTIREDISIIAEALVIPDPEQKEKHWDDGARTVIAGLIAHMVSSGNYEDITLPKIRDLISMPPKDQEDLWIDMIMNDKAGRLAKDAGARVMRGVGSNEMSSILSNADKHTEWLSAPVMQNVLSDSTFDFAEMKERPTTIFLILPPEKLVTYNRFLRLFVNLALSQISIGGKSKIPVLMIMDEFLALGRMEEVEKAMGLLAGYNLVLWPIVQEIGKLKDIYKSSFNAFINNSRAIQVFGVYGDTAEFVSKHLGERQSAPQSNNPNKWERVAKLRTANEVSIDVAIDAGWQYVIRAGKAPLVLEKVPYYEHSMFYGLYDKDPDYA